MRTELRTAIYVVVGLVVASVGLFGLWLLAVTRG
jgi:ABC-type transporter Mla subunit MlaD